MYKRGGGQFVPLVILVAGSCVAVRCIWYGTLNVLVIPACCWPGPGGFKTLDASFRWHDVTSVDSRVLLLALYYPRNVSVLCAGNSNNASLPQLIPLAKTGLSVCSPVVCFRLHRTKLKSFQARIWNDISTSYVMLLPIRIR